MILQVSSGTIAFMIELQAKARTALGKKVKKLRSAGLLPAVIYGGKSTALPLSISIKDFLKVWRSAGESSLVNLKIDGGAARSVLIHDVSLDPLKDTPTHVDFYEARADHTIKVHVPLKFTGESEAVKSLGGVLLKVIHEVEVEAFPKDLPHEVSVDISKLKTFEDSINLGDIELPSRVKILGDQDALIAKVTPPRSDEELGELEQKEELSLESIEIVKKGKKEEDAEVPEPEKAE